MRLNLKPKSKTNTRVWFQGILIYVILVTLIANIALVLIEVAIFRKLIKLSFEIVGKQTKEISRFEKVVQ